MPLIFLYVQTRRLRARGHVARYVLHSTRSRPMHTQLVSAWPHVYIPVRALFFSSFRKLQQAFGNDANGREGRRSSCTHRLKGSARGVRRNRVSRWGGPWGGPSHPGPSFSPQAGGGTPPTAGSCQHSPLPPLTARSRGSPRRRWGRLGRCSTSRCASRA